jgi:hypothetical protein
MTHLKITLVFTSLFLILLGCAEEAPKQAPQPPAPSAVSLQAQIADALGTDANQKPVSKVAGTVTQRIEAGRYTYLELQQENETIWAAIPAGEVKVGDVVEVRSPSAMDNFQSPSLKRTFKLIYFGSGLVGAKPASAPKAATAPSPTPKVELPLGAITIESVHSGAAAMAGQTVKVSGKVVKFNEAILGVNWIHIQDGSGNGSAGTHDLTATTDIRVSVGETIVLEGVVVQDKDFGAGYRYPVLLEKAKLSK